MTVPTTTPEPPVEEKLAKKKPAKKKPATKSAPKKSPKKKPATKRAPKKSPKKRAKKKSKVRASDQGAGGVVVGEGVKSQMMRVDPKLGEYIRRESKRITRETGKYHNATDASRSLFAYLKHKAVKLAPWHDSKK